MKNGNPFALLADGGNVVMKIADKALLCEIGTIT